MEQKKYTKNDRKGKHLTYRERIEIETMIKKKHPISEIAADLRRHRRTIERELAKGKVEHVKSDLSRCSTYSADRGQDVHDLRTSTGGAELKLDQTTTEFISERIRKHHHAPDVVAHALKHESVTTTVCTKTIYNYIERGLIPGVSNATLPEKVYRKQRKHKIISRKRWNDKRTSIEERPAEIAERKVFGHWEMDLVEGPRGGSGVVLLTMVERKTRYLKAIPLKYKSQRCVLQALKCLERNMGTKKFRCVFKSITVDNGSEFLDAEALERSAFSRKQRLKLYYAHPYAAYERGSNENANRMIRRFILKGQDIGKYGRKRIREAEKWINTYPRKILNYKVAEACYEEAIAA